MKHLALMATLCVAAAPAAAETFDIVGPGTGPVHSVDSRDIDRLEARIDGGLAGARAASRAARNGIAGAAALSAVDFVRQMPAIGFGVSRWEGQTGWAVKGMLPFGERMHGTVGAFGAGDDAGAAASFVIGF